MTNNDEIRKPRVSTETKKSTTGDVEWFSDAKLWNEGKLSLGNLNYQEASEIVHAHPDLVNRYRSIIEQPGKLESVLKVVDGSPKHAEGLEPILKSNSELLRVYAKYARSLDNSAEQDKDQPLGRTRIIRSPNYKDVLPLLERNIKSYHELKQVLNNREYVRLTSFFDGVAALDLTQIKLNQETESIRISILPTNQKEYDFASLQLTIGEDGVISTASEWDDLQNLGYLTRNTKPIDEGKLLQDISSYSKAFNLTESKQDQEKVTKKLSEAMEENEPLVYYISEF